MSQLKIAGIVSLVFHLGTRRMLLFSLTLRSFYTEKYWTNKSLGIIMSISDFLGQL